MYNIDPNGTITLNGVTVPTILCHYDAHNLGLGSNHGDVYNWFKKYGKTMDDVRNDVAKLMNKRVDEEKSTSAFKVGDVVNVVAGAKYINGKSVPSWVIGRKIYVRELRGDDVVISTLKSGAVTGVVNQKYLTKVDQMVKFEPYLVRVSVGVLNIRSGAGITNKVVGKITNRGVYTIVEEDKSGKWGKLKSGAGWIYLPYTKKV